MSHGPPGPGAHVATIAHEGLIWDVYLDFENDPHRPTSVRARMRFDPPAGQEGTATARTAVIIIEDSYEEALDRARRFDDRQLQSLLRSVLPDEPGVASE